MNNSLLSRVLCLLYFCKGTDKLPVTLDLCALHRTTVCAVRVPVLTLYVHTAHILRIWGGCSHTQTDVDTPGVH